MGMMKDFKAFVMKGNVLDLAVAVVIGAAFGLVITSLVGDVIMPVVGLALGGVDFTTLSITLKEGVGEDPPVLLMYGNFIQTVINFLIIALCIFLVIRGASRMHKKKEEAPAAPPEPSNEEKLLAEIRDALKARN